MAELCSSCHRSECEPQHSCFAAFVAALPDDTRRDFFDALDLALHVPCPTPGACYCLIDHDNPHPALVAKPGLRPCQDKELAAGSVEVLPCACTGDETDGDG